MSTTEPTTDEATPSDNGTDATVNRTDDRPMPTNIVQAVARVMEEMPAIARQTGAQHRERTGAPAPSGDDRGVSFPYRSIDQITSAAQALFARYGVVPAPKVHSHKIKDITVNNRPWTDTILTVSYTFRGPAWTPDDKRDKIKVGPLLAIGRDNSDKGANKAMTQAFKYALIQLLTISDAKDDGDAHAYEASYRDQPAPQSNGEPPPNEEMISWTIAAPDMIAALKRQIADLPEDHRKALAAEWRVDPPLHAIDYLEQGEEFGRADKMVYAHTLAVHTERNTLPPPSVAEAFNLNPATAVDPAEAVEAIGLSRDLAALVLAVPAEGKDGRLILQSRLTGLFGPVESRTVDQLREAIRIAEAWPGDPTTESAPANRPPEGQESADLAPSVPATAPDGETPPGPPPLPSAVADEIEAEVRTMSVTDLAEELRKRDLPIPTTKSKKVEVLLAARLGAAASNGSPAVG